MVVEYSNPKCGVKGAGGSLTADYSDYTDFFDAIHSENPICVICEICGSNRHLTPRPSLREQVP
jgi:hypothetical protein